MAWPFEGQDIIQSYHGIYDMQFAYLSVTASFTGIDFLAFDCSNI